MSIIIKTVYDQDIRRFKVPETKVATLFAYLSTSVRGSYDLKTTDRVRLSYKDDEGDLCQVQSEEEMAEALRLAGAKRVVKMFLTVQPGGAPAAASAAPSPIAAAAAADSEDDDLVMIACPSPIAVPEPVPEEVKDPRKLLDAKFLADVNLPDDSLVEPESTLTKVWKFENSGRSSWPAGVEVVHVKGDLKAAAPVSVPEAASGAQVDLSMDVLLPSEPGVVRGEFQLMANKEKLGQTFWLQVTVKDYCPTVEQLLTGFSALLTETKIQDEVRRLVPLGLETLAKADTTAESAIRTVLDASPTLCATPFVETSVLPFLPRLVAKLPADCVDQVREALYAHVAQLPMALLSGSQPQAQQAQEQEQKQEKEVVHYHVVCDGCNMRPIKGTRFKCSVCPDFDLCQACEAKQVHPADHVLIKMARPVGGGGCRRNGPHNGPRPFGFLRRLFAGPPHHNGHRGPHPCHKKQQRGDGKAKTKCKFVDDISLPDGTVCLPGATVTKTWRLANLGEQPWPADSTLEFVGGDLSPLSDCKVGAVAGLAEVDVTAEIKVPSTAGKFVGFYRMKADRRFGPRVWVQLVVEEAAAAGAEKAIETPAPAAVTPEVEAQEKLLVAEDSKALKQAAKQAEKAAKQAEKAAEKAAKQAEKAAKQAEKQAAKLAKQAANQAKKAEREAEKKSLAAAFVADVTIPDGMPLDASSVVTKTWTLSNCGTVAWPVNTVLKFVGGDLKPVEDEGAVSSAAVGEAVDVSVDIGVPSAPGRYKGMYRLQSGKFKFGPRVWIDATVPDVKVAVPDVKVADVKAVEAPVAVEAEVPTTPAPAPAAVSKDPKVAMLMSMGFGLSESHLQVLLESAKGDVGKVVNWLIAGKQ